MIKIKKIVSLFVVMFMLLGFTNNIICMIPSKKYKTVEEALKGMFGKSYPVFVKELGENIKDPKFLSLLNTGDNNLDKVEFEHDVVYKVSDLVPTQNEIDIEKSLKYPLVTDPSPLMEYLTSKNGLNSKGQPFAPGGAIVTAGGKYIVDGHHRWSQLYLINPNAKIKAINMVIDKPVSALKISQAAIAAVTGKVPSVKVEAGKNIFVMDKDKIRDWVGANIKEDGDALKAFLKSGKLNDGKGCGKNQAKFYITEYIWKNVDKMRKNNVPILGATSREPMPQTDTATEWSKRLEEGKVKVRFDK